MTRPSAEQWCAAGLAVVAVAYLMAGRRYPLDTLATPGPGIFPLAAGLALLGLALWQFLAARWAPPPAGAAGQVTRGPLLMSAALVIYAAALPRLGFLPTSFALVVVAARLMGLEGWWRPAALAVGVTLASRVIFGSWLGVPLP
jgi:hypothetical protein